MPYKPTAPPPVNLWVRWALRALLLCALLLRPALARADDVPRPVPKLPPFLRVEYVTGALKTCPDQEAFEHSVSATAQRDPFNNIAPALLRVTIERRGALYAATVEVRDSEGSLVWLRPF